MKIGAMVRGAYAYDSDAASAAVGLVCEVSEFAAQQQFADECDINTIVKRFGLTGELPANVAVPVSGDFTGVSDFQSAMQAVRKAEEGFMQLPGALRARFHHDPQELMVFMEDVRNRDEAVRLGLVNPAPEPGVEVPKV